MNQKQYAYGKDTIRDCNCPAVEAGFTPGDGDRSTAVAEWYDSIVRELDYGTVELTIPEEKAKEAWLKTVEQLRGRYHEDSEIVRTAEEIAETLGWL